MKKEFLYIGVAAIILYFIFTKFLKKAKNVILETPQEIVNVANDVFAGTKLGEWLNVKSTQADAALKGLNAMQYLTEGFYQAASNKYNNLNYILDGWKRSEADQLATNLINANSWIPFGLNDDSKTALAEIRKIRNFVQASQTAHAYYSQTGKDLANGLAWMKNEYLIEANLHLSKIPTGVIQKSTGKELLINEIQL